MSTRKVRSRALDFPSGQNKHERVCQGNPRTGECSFSASRMSQIYVCAITTHTHTHTHTHTPTTTAMFFSPHQCSWWYSSIFKTEPDVQLTWSLPHQFGVQLRMVCTTPSPIDSNQWAVPAQFDVVSRAMAQALRGQREGVWPQS